MIQNINCRNINMLHFIKTKPFSLCKTNRHTNSSVKINKNGLPHQMATRLSWLIAKTRSFPPLPHGRFGFFIYLILSYHRKFTCQGHARIWFHGTQDKYPFFLPSRRPEPPAAVWHLADHRDQPSRCAVVAGWQVGDLGQAEELAHQFGCEFDDEATAQELRIPDGQFSMDGSRLFAHNEQKKIGSLPRRRVPNEAFGGVYDVSFIF